jgi:hypothetical protein
MLVAILMHHGGSLELPGSAFETDALGTSDGAHHAIEVTPVDGSSVRLSVVPRPPGPDAGIEVRGT